jgi:hypothetical protein
MKEETVKWKGGTYARMWGVECVGLGVKVRGEELSECVCVACV